MIANAQPRKGVFISYARADGECAAQALHARLSADLPDIASWLDFLPSTGRRGTIRH